MTMNRLCQPIELIIADRLVFVNELLNVPAAFDVDEKLLLPFTVVFV